MDQPSIHPYADALSTMGSIYWALAVRRAPGERL